MTGLTDKLDEQKKLFVFILCSGLDLETWVVFRNSKCSFCYPLLQKETRKDRYREASNNVLILSP